MAGVQIAGGRSSWVACWGCMYIVTSYMAGRRIARDDMSLPPSKLQAHLADTLVRDANSVDNIYVYMYVCVCVCLLQSPHVLEVNAMGQSREEVRVD